MDLLARLNPRRRLAAAIGWAVFAVIGTAALITANSAAGDAERRAIADAKEILTEYATQVRDAMSMQVESRRAALIAAATGLSVGAGRESLTADLHAIGRLFPEFAWLGVTDRNGRVVASVGETAAPSPSTVIGAIARGASLPLVSDVPALPAAQSAAAARVMLVAVALAGSADHLLVAELPWAWIDRLLERMRAALEPPRPLEVLVTTRDGTVLIGPPAWLGRPLRDETEASEHARYLVGSRSERRLADSLGTGWTAFVREPVERALEPVKAVRRTVFVTVLLAGLLAAVAAVGVTHWATRSLRQLATQAEQIRRGERPALRLPSGDDEVAGIAATMGELIDHLQREKRALVDLNRDLDARVAERTERIERMAEEARHAAVTRERLQIARDLHDTMAHSLMALLTQIRLVRKLSTRLRADELDAELARAEGVAADGLAETRTAIRRIRASGVRESGLGPAITELARRCTERSGLPVHVEADPRTIAWADERADNVYRIVEEALRNVERHAEATSVRLRIVVDDPAHADDAPDRRFRIEIVDDGRGFDTRLAPAGHFGIVGMHERAALIGASLDVASAPGRGTRITLLVPAA